MTRFILYHYSPSTPAAVVFITLFAITTILHFLQTLMHKTWFFIPFILGGIFEITGYTARLISGTQAPNFPTGPYITQSLTILLAPALLAASIYMLLARLINLTHGERHSLINIRWITTLFVSDDVLSFLAQAGGDGMLARAKSSSQRTTGQRVIIGGLGVHAAVHARHLHLLSTDLQTSEFALKATSRPMEKDGDGAVGGERIDISAE